ncbi:MAG: UDP-N-acetylmuramate dehydrogenase [Armatimonadetes bacterium]|nr:UDP-N-acetylmuramate dehydrogenase [Armatimonadota bacterium]
MRANPKSKIQNPKSDAPPEGFTGRFKRDEPLGRYTTFRIGGPADGYAEPQDRDDLARLLLWARDRDLPITVLGGGSNLLISDEGVRGLVIRLNRLKALRFEGNDVIAEAGLPLVSFLRRVADRGLAGMEGVVGVPGAVGGALVMNAGTPHGEFGDHLIEAEIMQPDGTLLTVPREYLGLGYRSSQLKERGEMVVSVRLRLLPGDPEAVRAEMEKLDVHRHETQPLKIPNAGCIWKNPKPHAAGRLVDEAGCKGMREGGAEVSTVHGNFIVNHGGAAAADVIRLMKRVRARVEDVSGIRLEPEVQLMGAMDWES